MNTMKKMEFSKLLLVQESALIWIMTLVFLVLAFYCISQGFMGTLPWLAAMVGCPWTAYAVSQAFYYKKAMSENCIGGLKYEATLAELNQCNNNNNEMPEEVENIYYPTDEQDYRI
jgi:hypothetical protein